MNRALYIASRGGERQKGRGRERERERERGVVVCVMCCIGIREMYNICHIYHIYRIYRIYME